jgi:hypothetical protein
MDVVNNQLEVRVVSTRGKRVRPPRKAEYHEKYTIWSPMIKVIEREILRELSVGRWPCFASSGLDGEPPLGDGLAELLWINIVTTFKVAGPLDERGHLSRPVFRRYRSMFGL